MEKNFAIAFSDREQSHAIKEISLKIKSVFPATVKCILLFFTPQYNPTQILESINFTLTPQLVIGVQSPLLIFQDTIVSQGIIAGCINKQTAAFKDAFVRKDQEQTIEGALRTSAKDFPGEKEFLLTFATQHFCAQELLRGTHLALGKMFPVLGGGFLHRYGTKNYQLVNTTIDEGVITLFGKALSARTINVSGFVPIGQPFEITKAIPSRNRIVEINGAAAADIYRKYLEEKFDAFMRNNLFSLYPLGIKTTDGHTLIHVSEVLEDGSLFCIGNIPQREEANIMLFHPQTLHEDLLLALSELTPPEDNLVFLINSLSRKKIIKDCAQEELKQIKKTLGNHSNIIGCFFDYAIFTPKSHDTQRMETNTLLVTTYT